MFDEHTTVPGETFTKSCEKCNPPTKYPDLCNQGWQCPLCKVVHSPDVKECDCEKNEPILDAMDGPDWCIGSD